MDRKDSRKFWLAVGLCAAGVGLLFVGMLVDPKGVIDPTVIAGAGEIFITAGAILGIDAAYSNKLKQIIKELTETNERKNNEK